LLAVTSSFDSARAVDPNQRIFVLTDISNDPDDEQSMMRFLVYSNEHEIDCTWFVYPKTGTYQGEVELAATSGHKTTFTSPESDKPATIHVILQVEDRGEPSLVAYRRVVVEVRP